MGQGRRLFYRVISVFLIHAVTGPALWTIQFGFGKAFHLNLAALIGRSLIYCVIGFLVFGCISFLCAFVAGSRIGALSLSLVTVQVLGVLAANSVSIKHPVISRALVFFFRLTAFLQLNVPYIVPLKVTFFSSLVWVTLMLMATRARFEKRDLK